MPSHRTPARLLDRLTSLELIVVTGKGGVGKTSLSAALGNLLTAAGRTVLLLETDPRESLHRLLDVPPSGGEIVDAGRRLFLQNLQPRTVLDDLVEERLKVGLLTRRVLASPVYQHFAEGAPGLKEAAILGRALRIVEGHGPRRLRKVDTVILDAPATGHGVTLLQAPLLVAEVIDSGPVHRMARDISAFLSDARRSGIVIATLAEEMPVNETLQLVELLDARLARRPEAIVVNGLYPPVTGTGPEAATDDPALALWRERRCINDEQLGRLRDAWTGPLAELPLLPIDPGPALAGALARHLGEGLGATAAPEDP